MKPAGREKKHLRNPFRPRTRSVIPARTLRVLTWNIGFGCAEDDLFFLEPRKEPWVRHNLDGIIRTIRDVDPDIVLLQEVDFKSSRTHMMDQAAYITQGLSLGKRNLVCAENVHINENDLIMQGARFLYRNRFRSKYLEEKFNFIPGTLPDTPIHLSLGLATLSKYEIRESWNHQFTSRIPLLSFLRLITRQDEQKTYQECKVHYGGEVPLYAVNTHLENMNVHLRAQEAKHLVNYLKRKRGGAHYFVGGDFNCVNPWDQQSDFPAGDNDDYTGCTALEHLLDSDCLWGPSKYSQSDMALLEKEAIDLGKGIDAFVNNDYTPLKRYTYPASAPNRELDRILRGHLLDYALDERGEEKYFVLDTNYSDHRPVVAELTLPADIVRSGRFIE